MVYTNRLFLVCAKTYEIISRAAAKVLPSHQSFAPLYSGENIKFTITALTSVKLCRKCKDLAFGIIFILIWDPNLSNFVNPGMKLNWFSSVCILIGWGVCNTIYATIFISRSLVVLHNILLPWDLPELTRINKIPTLAESYQRPKFVVVKVERWRKMSKYSNSANFVNSEWHLCEGRDQKGTSDWGRNR